MGSFRAIKEPCIVVEVEGTCLDMFSGVGGQVVRVGVENHGQ